MKHSHGTLSDLDVDRLKRDRSYRESVARELLALAGADADHVQLRRAARRAFPRLEREAGRLMVGRLVGTASTLREAGNGASRQPAAHASEQVEQRVGSPEEGGPLDYPARYTDLRVEKRNILIRFCDARIQDGCEGKEALEAVRDEFGWPYPDRTFYVGPWKAARMRRRKIERRRAARAAAERAARGEARGGLRASRSPSRTGSGSADGNSADGNGPEGEPAGEPADVPLDGEEEGEVELATPRAHYRAVRQDGGEWDVQVRAKVDGRAMRRLFADAVDVLFRGEASRTREAAGDER